MKSQLFQDRNYSYNALLALDLNQFQILLIHNGIHLNVSLRKLHFLCFFTNYVFIKKLKALRENL